MLIKKVIAKTIKNSRKEETIQVIVKTKKGKFITSAPGGKSTGRFEKKPYFKGLRGDISFINKLNIAKLKDIINDNNKLTIIQAFFILGKIEKLVKSKIGANSLFALEASILKALAKENKKQLFEFLGGKRIPRSVGNAVGGGLHNKTKTWKKPQFQEFLFIANQRTISENIEANLLAYNLVKKELKAKKRNDEGAWETERTDEQILEIISEVRKQLKKKNIKVDIGVDIAASTLYQGGRYFYERPYKNLSRNEQIKYIKDLIDIDKIFYVEDPLHQGDFSGFAKLKRRVKRSLIVGDDLTVTNPKRLELAIKNKSINAIIIKPNQIGSLLEVKQVIDVCKKYKIKTIMSHRSGETTDDTIADLAVGWGCDFIKTGIYGKVREAKLNRLVEIERRLKK